MQELFLWHLLYLERIQGVLDGVRRGPVGPLGPLELAALPPRCSQAQTLTIGNCLLLAICRDITMNVSRKWVPAHRHRALLTAYRARYCRGFAHTIIGEFDLACFKIAARYGS